jgi:hypothetical protein
VAASCANETADAKRAKANDTNINFFIFGTPSARSER